MISRAASFVEKRLARVMIRGSERLLPALGLPVSPFEASARLLLKQVRAENRFFSHVASWGAVCTFLISINLAAEPDAPWSLIITGIWGAAVALHGRRTLRKRRRTVLARHRELVREVGRLTDGEGEPPALPPAPGAGADGEDTHDEEIQGLRDQLSRAAAAARDLLRASRPEMLPEITRGETRALTLLAWLAEAGPAAERNHIDHELRQAATARLAGARTPEARQAFENLLARVDAYEQGLGDLQRRIAGRRQRLESFLLALESTKAAAAAGSDPGTVSASLRERIEALDDPDHAAPGDASPAAAASTPADRFEEEVRLAQDLQRSILPAAAPRVDGLRVAHLYRPSNEVGGDFYDFYDTGENRLLVAIGDASGHGLDSSMVSSMAKSAVYMQLAGRRARSAERLPAAMAEINRMMCDTLGRRRLMTLALVEIDTAARTLSWVNAGQVYPLLVRAGEVLELEQPSYPLGIRRQIDYGLRTDRLESGDLLLFLTDGYVEAQNPDGDPLGWDRLRDTLARAGTHEVESLLEVLDQDLDRYLGTSSPQDDVTLIALHYFS